MRVEQPSYMVFGTSPSLTVRQRFVRVLPLAEFGSFISVPMWSGIGTTMAGQAAIGVALDTVGSGSLTSGLPFCAVQTTGVAVVEAGGSFAYGDAIMSDSVGRAVKWDGSGHVVGVAMTVSDGTYPTAEVRLGTDGAYRGHLLNPHNDTGGATTVVFNWAAASGVTISNLLYAVAGTDTAGVITITNTSGIAIAATSPVSTVTFGKSVGVAPSAVLLTAQNAGGAVVQPYVASVSSTGFVIGHNVASPGGTTSVKYAYLALL